MPRYCPLLQTQPEGGQGQHCEVQVENASTAAGDGAAQLCGSGGGRAGKAWTTSWQCVTRERSSDDVVQVDPEMAHPIFEPCVMDTPIRTTPLRWAA